MDENKEENAIDDIETSHDRAADDSQMNPDPLTGEPGSHPVGTSVGAASGGLTGAAIGAAVGGPIGAAVGAVVGGVAGAYGGRGVAEAMNPTEEEAYWRENHQAQPFAEADRPYESYAPAYRTGYEAAAKHAGKEFHEIENDIAKDYESSRPDSALPWDKARPATHAAWSKVSGVVAPRDPTRGMRTGM